MADKSRIHWTDATWNPVTGCSKVSEGCRHCYAEVVSLRFKRSEKPWTAPNAAENVVLHPDRLTAPLAWKRPRRIFVNSMSDLFHEQVPDEFILKVFTVMAQPLVWGEVDRRHTFQILTKRPDRMAEFMGRLRWRFGGPWRMEETGSRPLNPVATLTGEGSADPASHIWLGTSVERQREADERIPHLLATPAAVRFLSCEPLLGPIDLAPKADDSYRMLSRWYGPNGFDPDGSQPERDRMTGYVPRVDWVIAGGESGAGHRPMDIEWARSLRDQCTAAGIPFFFKQSSGLRPGMGRELDGRLWEEFPTVAEREAVPA